MSCCGSSRSDIRKRVVKPQFDVKAYLKTIEECSLSDEAIAAIEGHIEQRHQPSNRECHTLHGS